jgi:coproporphyrinogen III oxidase-like Fe-S oxidoreductase
MGETMLMGLRLTREGVSRADFRTRFACEIEDVFGVEIETLRSQGLLSWGDENGERLQLTHRGLLLEIRSSSNSFKKLQSSLTAEQFMSQVCQNPPSLPWGFACSRESND